MCVNSPEVKNIDEAIGILARFIMDIEKRELPVGETDSKLIKFDCGKVYEMSIKRHG